MVLPDITIESVEKNIEIKKFSEIEEIPGKIRISDEAKKLLRSVIENDKDIIEDGKLIRESYNQGVYSFTPSLIFEKIVKNFSLAKQLYGETMIRLLTGYDPHYIEKNISVPEFRKLIKKAIEEKVRHLKEKNLIEREEKITEKASELASLIILAEEIDKLIPKGYTGNWRNKKKDRYGEKDNYTQYKKGIRYRDIAVKSSIKLAIRRAHSEVTEKDLKAFERKGRGKITLIYAIDSSGSMRGKKIDAAKKAGIALAYNAIEQGDKVGIIIFGDKVRNTIMPTQDFTSILKEVTKVSASKETNITLAIKKSSEMFVEEGVTKHLILITDALPTAGKYPKKETLEAVAEAKAKEVTISIVGICLDKEGEKLCSEIVRLSGGRFYKATNFDDVDKIILEDYWAL
ncbi:MAG: VWA domain-containing protein [Candidatus Woesearchaeota archaeon]